MRSSGTATSAKAGLDLAAEYDVVVTYERAASVCR
jgi:hypothetical protein